MATTDGDWPWTQVFLAVALRAIRRVHLEYGIWGAGRQWSTNRNRVATINQGRGVELADERAVCAAISQEFMTSPSAAGLWRTDEKADFRFFGIKREERYSPSAKKKNKDEPKEKKKDSPRWVDLIVEKYTKDPESNDFFHDPVKYPPVYIEAKRARRWLVNLKTGNTTAAKGRQTTDICADIMKLTKERETQTQRIFIYILVWGVYEEGKKPGDHPATVFTEIRNKIGGRAVVGSPLTRWLPTKWTDPEPASEQMEQPRVQRSVWIALSEIDRHKGPSP
jgi:hypothetical protein